MGTSTVATILSNKKKTSWNLDDLFKQIEIERKPDEIKEYPEDILVLSCCIQRLAHNRSMRFNRSLNGSDLPSLVSDLDRQKAKNIRKYYNDKLMLLTLQGRQLTKFRKDLQMFLNSEPTKVLESLCGIVYKLPYFYDYDKSIDNIFKSSYFKNTSLNNMHENARRDLKFLSKIENERKHSNNVEYWFEDELLNKVMFSIASNNPLLDLLDRHINDGRLSVSAQYYLRKKDLNEYFVMEKWSFV